MSVVRVGIVGLGGMGSHHAGYLIRGEVPGAELTAVCDVAPGRLEWAQANLGGKVQCFADAEALFAAQVVDAVVIATPHYFHPTVAVQAFGHGVHVLSEKPAGVYTKQVREMNEAAEASGLVFGLMFNQRTRPVHRKMRDLVASGELGEIRRTNWIITDWFRSQAYYDSGGWRATWAGEGGGVLINQCPHNLDLWQWICGMPVRCRASIGFGRYHEIEVDDDVTAFVEYENGATGVFITTTGEAPGTNRFEVTGDRGKLVLEDGRLTFWRTTTSVAEFIRESQTGFATPEVWKCDIPSGGSAEEHKAVTKAWVKAISDGTPLVAPGQEGIRSLQISNAMMLSAWTDSWIDLPVDEELFYAQLQERISASQVNKAEGGKTMDVTGTF